MERRIIKCLIVDDEPKARDLLENFIADIPDINIIGKAEGVDEAIELLNKNNPDLVFLDIQMPNKDGFEFMRELKVINANCKVIFVTAHDEYAIKAIKSSAFDYLLKPINPEEIKQSISRFREQKIEMSFDEKVDVLLSKIDNNRRIRCKTKNGQIWIDPNEIFFCIADGNYCKIFFSGGRSEFLSINLGTLTASLPSDIFFRIDRSILINLKCLVKFDRRKRLCSLVMNGESKEFKITASRLKTLEKSDFFLK